MSCFNECTELVVYDYAHNVTVNLDHCICTGCCYNINIMMNMFIFFFMFVSFILIGDLNKKYRKVFITIPSHEERLPEYTETV